MCLKINMSSSSEYTILHNYVRIVLKINNCKFSSTNETGKIKTCLTRTGNVNVIDYLKGYTASGTSVDAVYCHVLQ